MDWVKHAIWWQVYPLGFCGAPIREPDPAPGPRLRRLLNWLDYAISLGSSGLLLGPIFTAETHGYDTLDHFAIDPRLGSLTDFDDLVSGCRQRGLRLLLDGVFSHVGARHPDLLRALQDGPGSPQAALFDIDWDTPGGPRPRVFEGHDSLVRLNHANEQTVAQVTRIMNHWLDRGIDGWRLDAAYSVPPEFWANVLPRVRERHPQAWFLGEVIHGDYAQFVASSTVDSVTQYELWKAIWSAIKDRNLFELDWALQRHNDFLTHFTPNTFIGNHDVSRIASTIGQDAAVSALAILLTVGGIPTIYYGDEQGYTGLKEERLGGDDEIRPPYCDRPDQLADWGQHVFRAHQELIGLRRRNAWLTTARTVSLQVENTRYRYRVAAADGDAHLDVEIDLAGKPTATIRDRSGEILWTQYR